MLLRTPEIDTASFEKQTGWTFKPEGACKGDVCIPLSTQPGATIDALQLAQDIGLPVAKNEDHGLLAIGPESVGSRALTSAELPDIRLPDLDGNEFSVRSLVGQKIIIYAWAPY
jgi:hypothetical protein